MEQEVVSYYKEIREKTVVLPVGRYHCFFVTKGDEQTSLF